MSKFQNTSPELTKDYFFLFQNLAKKVHDVEKHKTTLHNKIEKIWNEMDLLNFILEKIQQQTEVIKHRIFINNTMINLHFSIHTIFLHICTDNLFLFTWDP